MKIFKTLTPLEQAKFRNGQETMTNPFLKSAEHGIR